MIHRPTGRFFHAPEPQRGRDRIVYQQIVVAAKWTIAVAGTVATYLWGGWDTVLLALVCLTCMDYVTGVGAAWTGKRLSSEVGAQGIARKVGIFVVVAVANVIDQTGGLGEPILRTVVVWFYVANEALSIAGNLGEIGVPIPEALTKAIQNLRDRGDAG